MFRDLFDNFYRTLLEFLIVLIIVGIFQWFWFPRLSKSEGEWAKARKVWAAETGHTPQQYWRDTRMLVEQLLKQTGNSDIDPNNPLLHER